MPQILAVSMHARCNGEIDQIDVVQGSDRTVWMQHLARWVTDQVGEGCDGPKPFADV